MDNEFKVDFIAESEDTWTLEGNTFVNFSIMPRLTVNDLENMISLISDKQRSEK